MNHYVLKSFATDDALAQAAASAWVDEVAQAECAGKTFTVALSGGRIARKFYSGIVTQASRQDLRLIHTHFFWADERCVPPDDAESNFALARECLFTPLGTASGNIHRVLGEESPDFAATEAEAEISRIADLSADGLPMLDLVILGLGEDGHVASLFPGAPQIVTDSRHSYLPISGSPKPPANRVTLSYAALATARRVWVLASGSGKAAALQRSLNSTDGTPLARVINSRKETWLFSDLPAF
jgi:6-phosphogluconolactonase